MHYKALKTHLESHWVWQSLSRHTPEPCVGLLGTSCSLRQWHVGLKAARGTLSLLDELCIANCKQIASLCFKKGAPQSSAELSRAPLSTSHLSRPWCRSLNDLPESKAIGIHVREVHPVELHRHWVLHLCLLVNIPCERHRRR